MRLRFPESVDDAGLIFADVVAMHRGRYVLCRHRERTSLEWAGGHREAGESIEQTARRELWEETGATRFDLRQVCAYGVVGTDGNLHTDEEVFGMLYFAEIHAFGPLPNYEIAQVVQLDKLPENWTYSAHAMFARRALMGA